MDSIDSYMLRRFSQEREWRRRVERRTMRLSSELREDREKMTELSVSARTSFDVSFVGKV